MSPTRGYEDILSDVERWAAEKLRRGEERLYLGERVKSQVPGAIGHEQVFDVKQMAKTTATKSTSILSEKSPASGPTPLVPGALPLAPEPWQAATDLPTLKSLIENCTKCELHMTRTKFVFGVGNPNAKVMVIGEAPGAEEDKQGEPFVGRAGQLLDKMLLAINFPRQEVFIANILKSRPPGNRDPLPVEVAACEPYLWKQIDIIKPKMILCMGRIAGMNLLKNGIDTLKGMRGNIYDFRGAKVMVTYHPAALLRNPAWKVGAWEDLQKFRKIYDEMIVEQA